jgi:hypothetical protein
MRPIAGTITDPAVTRAMNSLPDVMVANEGSIFIVTGTSAAGRNWLAENVVTEDTMLWGHGVVVEHRYFEDVFDGMVDAGLIVR